MNLKKKNQKSPKSNQRKKSNGFTLVECLLVIGIFLSLHWLLTTYNIFATTQLMHAQVKHLSTACALLAIRARITGQDAQLSITPTTHSYTIAGTTHQLPAGCSFSAPLGALGPPGKPTLPVGAQKQTTFVWHKDGCSTPGTLYVCTASGYGAAISIPHTATAPPQLYWWRKGRWIRNNE